MATPQIKIDQSGKPAGVGGTSRSDLANAVEVSVTDSANGAGSRLWELIVPPGSVATLDSASAATVHFTPDIPGVYLVYSTFEGTQSWTDNVVGDRVTTQGGGGVVFENGTLAPGTGETLQFDSTHGWALRRHTDLEILDKLVPSVAGGNEGAIIYQADDDDLAQLTPGTAGYVLSTAGPGAAPVWVDPTTLGGGNTLDAAYDQGGAGAGRTINATDGAVVIQSTEPDNTNLLELSLVPGSSASGHGLQIAMGANATGSAILATHAGSGATIMSLGAGSDQSAIIGRTLLDSRTSTIAYWSNAAMTTALEYGVFQTAAGQLALNCKVGTNLSLRINNSINFQLDAAEGFHANDAAGPMLVNAVGTNSEPNVVPDRSDPGTGMYTFSSGTLGFAAGTTLRLTIAAAATFAASVNPSGSNTFTLGTGSAGWKEIHQQRNALGEDSTDSALGIAMVNSTAAALDAQQYSGMLVQEGQGWQKVANTSHEVQFGTQVIPVQQGDSVLPTGELHWFSNINDAGWISQANLAQSATSAIFTVGSLDASHTGVSELSLKTNVRASGLRLNNATGALSVVVNETVGLLLGAAGGLGTINSTAAAFQVPIISGGDITIPASSVLFLDADLDTYWTSDSDDTLQAFCGGQETLEIVGGGTSPTVTVGSTDTAHTGTTSLDLRTDVRLARIQLLNSTGKLVISPNSAAIGLQFGAGFFDFTDAGLTFNQDDKTSGTPSGTAWNYAAHTGLDNQTITDVLFDLSRTVTHTGGSGPPGSWTNYGIRILAPTYTWAANPDEGVIDATTLYVSGAPTLTGFGAAALALAVHIDAGIVSLDDQIEMVERAARVRAPGAGRGALWVQDQTASVLVFTDDANIDHDLINSDYAEIWVHNGATTQVTDGTTDTFNIITGFNTAAGQNGGANGATPDKANNKIVLTKAGRYRISFTVSFEGTTNETFTCAAFVDGSEHNGAAWKRKIGTGTDVASASFHGIVTATAAQDLDVRVKAVGTSSDFIPRFMNLAATWLGS